MTRASVAGRPARHGMEIVRGRAWAPGPERPRLREGVVDVWRVDLARLEEGALGCLAQDERERARGILNARRGLLWACSRAALRVLLGRYLDLDPRELRFVAGARGKPALAPADRRGEPYSEELHFSLSHSDALALYAFSDWGPVGIDVQLPRSGIDHVGLAARAFGAGLAQALRSLPAGEREREFLRQWVRREAAAKCCGRGLPPAQAPAPAGETACSAPEQRPWLCELDLASAGLAALAAARRPDRLALWIWRR